MSNFPKVANIQIGDNVYDVKDNLDRAKFNVEKNRTLDADNNLILNKASLANTITEKGVTTNASDSLMTMAENITNIKLGDSPAIGVLSSIACKTDNVANSVWYNYPLVYRSSRGEYYTSYSDGSGGFKYELTNGNVAKKDAVIVTRFYKDPDTTNNFIPVIFFNALLPVLVGFNNGRYSNDLTNISIKIDGGNFIKVPFPTSETLTVNDFYIKCEISTLSATQCSLKFSLSAPDEDGKATTWSVLTTEPVTISDTSPDLHISMIGTDIKWYAEGKLIDNNINSDSSGDLWHKRYGNYIDETCIAVKDSNDIFNVVLGASSLYPMG